MNAADAVKRLEEIKRDAGDIEADHSEADKVLCDLLYDMGHADVVKAWEAISKWYA